jgi:hypothetical protein
MSHCCTFEPGAGAVRVTAPVGTGELAVVDGTTDGAGAADVLATGGLDCTWATIVVAGFFSARKPEATRLAMPITITSADK